MGIGLFEVHPNGGPFTLGYKYVIQDPNGADLYSSPVVEENVTGNGAEEHIIKYYF
jgi:hypothetical protein